MNKLFLHHRYVDLPPRDVSGSDNHGVAHDVIHGTGPLQYSAQFDGVRSWVHVPHAPNMNDLTQFRAQVTFRLDASAPAGRMNLVEGFTSFALFVVGDGSVHFSILDRAGNWTVCSSAPGVVARGGWHTVVAAHDGVAEARVAVDAAVVARNANVVGPVRSVGALGVAVGRWPDSPAYLLHGNVSEVALYKFDPLPELHYLLGAGCVDVKRLQRVLARVVERVGADALAAWAAQFNGVVREAAVAFQVGADDLDAMRRLNFELVHAVAGRDRKAVARAVAAVSDRGRRRLDPATAKALPRRLAAVRDKLPLTPEEVRELTQALCLDRLT